MLIIMMAYICIEYLIFNYYCIFKLYWINTFLYGYNEKKKYGQACTEAWFTMDISLEIYSNKFHQVLWTLQLSLQFLQHEENIKGSSKVDHIFFTCKIQNVFIHHTFITGANIEWMLIGNCAFVEFKKKI